MEFTEPGESNIHADEAKVELSESETKSHRLTLIGPEAMTWVDVRDDGSIVNLHTYVDLSFRSCRLEVVEGVLGCHKFRDFLQLQ